MEKSQIERKQTCQRKQGRRAERSKEPGSTNSSVENSGTRVCAWVRIPLLSENVLNAKRQSFQLTNSVILEHQFKIKAQSKRKQKNGNIIGGRQPSGFQVHKKEDNQPIHVKHESTRGFERKSFHMDDTNRLADYISEFKKNYPMEGPQIERKKCVDGNKAEWPSGLRSQAQENPQSRILVHECARGFESNSCQKTFWTRWDRAFSWQILSHWNVIWKW